MAELIANFHFPSFVLGFFVCLVTPLVDFIAVHLMHKYVLKKKEEDNNG